MVDGNDVLAVWQEVLKAVARAREGEGPALIECKTMRIGGHHINDPGDYMDEKDSSYKDPIDFTKEIILQKKVATENELREIDLQIEKNLKEAVTFAEESPEPDVHEFLQESLDY